MVPRRGWIVVCVVQPDLALSGFSGRPKSMPLNSPASTTHLPDIAASESQPHSNRSSASTGRVQHLMLDIRKFKSAIGFSGSVVLSLGVVLAAICAVGAVLEGMAYSMA